MRKGTRHHCTWQAHDGERVFEVPGARAKFLELLAKYKPKYGILIHAFCLMGNHQHVLCCSPRGQAAFSAFWRDVNAGFGKWLNRKTGRRGQVIMDRMHSGEIQEDGGHGLAVMRYIDRNPKRAGLVKSPKDWPWGSYRHYAFGERHPLIDDAPEYLALGRNGPERRKRYRALFTVSLADALEHAHPDLVRAPFIGDALWVLERRASARSSTAPD